jgi:hypothetical protein
MVGTWVDSAEGNTDGDLDGDFVDSLWPLPLVGAIVRSTVGAKVIDTAVGNAVV